MPTHCLPSTTSLEFTHASIVSTSSSSMAECYNLYVQYTETQTEKKAHAHTECLNQYQFSLWKVVPRQAHTFTHWIFLRPVPYSLLSSGHIMSRSAQMLRCAACPACCSGLCLYLWLSQWLEEPNKPISEVNMVEWFAVTHIGFRIISETDFVNESHFLSHKSRGGQTLSEIVLKLCIKSHLWNYPVTATIMVYGADIDYME